MTANILFVLVLIWVTVFSFKLGKVNDRITAIETRMLILKDVNATLESTNQALQMVLQDLDTVEQLENGK